MGISELKRLYKEESKHSGYQVLSKQLSRIIDNSEIETKSRYELERLTYILKNIDVQNKKALDIGGNTGFFTFELIDSGAKSVHYYEGNCTHAKFVLEASKVLNIENKLEITNEYFSFDHTTNNKYDLILLLNILHHIGDDYGDKGLSMKKVKETIINQLNYLAQMTELMVFQLGFNWMGNRELGIFQNGTKEEMIDFIREGIKDYWQISQIGIPEYRNGIIEYCDMSKENINRWDHMGEFLNRPLFIMKSIKYQK